MTAGLIGTWLDLRRDQAEDAIVEVLTTHHELPEVYIHRLTRLRAARVRRALRDLGERGVVVDSRGEVAWADGTPIPFYRLADSPTPWEAGPTNELIRETVGQIQELITTGLKEDAAASSETAARRREAAANPDIWRVGGSDPVDSVTIYQGTRFVGSTRTHDDAVFLVDAANYYAASDPNGHGA